MANTLPVLPAVIDQVTAAAERAGAAAAERRIAQIRAMLRADFPEIIVREERGALVLSGRGLLAQAARDARLRFIGRNGA